MLQEEKLNQIIKKERKVIDVAKDFNVTRQTIHKWLSRYKRFGIAGLIKKQRKKLICVPHNKTSEEIEQLVINLAREYFHDGVESLADRLQHEYNTSLHPTTIYRILKRKEVRYTENYPHTQKRWKKQLYSHKVPGKELQMDTKYPHGYKQCKVIYTIIDDASRWVFAWSYSKANANNSVDFLEKVIRRAPFNIRKIRTDQGTEFLNDKLKGSFKKHNITHRKNTPYCPEENGKIERFHKTLNQKALKYGFPPSESLDSMQYKLNLFLHYYNYQKKHRGLGMNGLTPMQKLEECKSVNLTLQCSLQRLTIT
ncbi:MAG: IS481 family transposase [Patescibacteria group bacterium]|nr:IS481 family transposase [Patescibacteria group bacterium]